MAKVNDPVTINGITLKNRLTVAPTVKFDYAGEDGKVTEKHIAHYAERANGGYGLICVEATAVTPEGRFGKNHLGLWEDAQIEGHRKIAKVCHEAGTAVILQINHTGITGNPEFGPAKGPSAVPTRDGGMSVEMSPDEIRNMQQAYIDAAKRAGDAGYDGIQLHGCHGYLINQFVSPKTNLRTDEYGKDRSLFASGIIRGIRQACGKDFLISIRTPGIEPDIENAVAVAKKYVEAGCDYLQVSHGIEGVKVVPQDEPFSDLCSLGINFRKAYDWKVPVSAVGGLLTPETVRYVIENDLIDTVDLARAALADPGFAKAVLEGKPYVKCFECKACQYGPFTNHICPAALQRKRAKQ
ncbi:MAG: NADH:flavin oxidoreductase [Lachnospiraceae bacterium]|nr:NADH:flavin oxidoreductase [Lachnospiraceae bacterium]